MPTVGGRPGAAGTGTQGTQGTCGGGWDAARVNTPVYSVTDVLGVGGVYRDPMRRVTVQLTDVEKDLLRS